MARTWCVAALPLALLAGLSFCCPLFLGPFTVECAAPQYHNHPPQYKTLEDALLDAKKQAEKDDVPFKYYQWVRLPQRWDAASSATSY